MKLVPLCTSYIVVRTHGQTTMDFTAEPLVKVTIRNDGVALLELNRPKKRNALSLALIDELIAAIELLEQNNAVKVIVLTGTPGGPFCGMCSPALPARPLPWLTIV